MSLLVNPNQAQIDELNRKLALQKQQAEKKLTRQKILLGSFLLDMLEKDKLDGARQYTIDNLDKFLTRTQDKELLAPVVDEIRKLVKGQAVGHSDSHSSDKRSLDNTQSQPTHSQGQ